MHPLGSCRLGLADEPLSTRSPGFDLFNIWRAAERASKPELVRIEAKSRDLLLSLHALFAR